MPPESSDRLADAIYAQTQELRVLREVLDEIRSELQYAVQNNKSLYLVVEDLLASAEQGSVGGIAQQLLITRMSKDPTRKDFKVTFGRETQEKPDLSSGPSVVCDVCGREVAVEVSQRQEWTDVARWKGGGPGAFLGICPACREPTELPAPQSPTQPGNERRGTLF